MKRLPATWLVFAVIVVDLTGFGIVIPILPFISPRLGGNAFDVALVIAIYSLCAGLVGPFWGGLSDRIGRKRVLMICLLGGALSYVLLGMATELWAVYVARGFGGLMAGSLPVASALLADLSTPDRRAKAMGLVGTAFGLGLILGPLLGGLLAGEGESFLLAGLFAGGLSLLSVVLAAVLLPDDRLGRLSPAAQAPLEAEIVTDSTVKPTPMGTDDKPIDSKTGLQHQNLSIPAFIRHYRTEWLVLQYVFHTLAVSAAIYLSPLWLAALLDWGPREVGILFGLVGLAMIVIQGALLDGLTHRFGLLNVLSFGAMIFAVSLLAAPIMWGEFDRALVILTAFTGATCCLPILNTIASSVVPDEQRGRMMGVTTMAASFGRVAGPLITGLVLTFGGYSWSWVILALPVLAVWVWSRSGARRYASINRAG